MRKRFPNKKKIQNPEVAHGHPKANALEDGTERRCEELTVKEEREHLGFKTWIRLRTLMSLNLFENPFGRMQQK